MIVLIQRCVATGPLSGSIRPTTIVDERTVRSQLLLDEIASRIGSVTVII